MNCLKIMTATNEISLWFHRSQGDLIQISRPNVIGDHNKNMGGVILRALWEYSATWWLWYCIGVGWIFYLLDVGNSNDLVLYNELIKK